MHPRLRADALRDLGQMQMVSQVDDLADPTHVGEKPQRLFGAEMVEGLHDVVGDEGGGLTSTDANDVRRVAETRVRGIDDMLMVGKQDRLHAVANRR